MCNWVEKACVVKKEKGCYFVLFIPVFVWWGRKEPSYFKIRGPPTVQSDIMPFSCVKGLKKVCPDFFEVCNLLLLKAIFSFKRLKGTSKRANPQEDFIMKAMMLWELLHCSWPQSRDSQWHGRERWTHALAKEPATRMIRVQKVLFHKQWLKWSGLLSLATVRYMITVTNYAREEIENYMNYLM